MEKLTRTLRLGRAEERDDQLVGNMCAYALDTRERRKEQIENRKTQRKSMEGRAHEKCENSFTHSNPNDFLWDKKYPYEHSHALWNWILDSFPSLLYLLYFPFSIKFSSQEEEKKERKKNLAQPSSNFFFPMDKHGILSAHPYSPTIKF